MTTVNKDIRFELRQLRYFVVAARLGSFRKAGIELCVNESAISRRIRDLEDRLGASLFQRSSSGVVLTVAGAQLLEHAQSVMKQLDDAARAVAAVGGSQTGHVRVGVLSSIASGFLSELFRAFYGERPGVRVDFRDGHPMEHVDAVRRMEMDVAFIVGTTPHANCDTIPLWSENIFAAMPSGHKLAHRRAVAWQELIGETFIVGDQAPGFETEAFLVRRLSEFGLHPRVDRQDVGCENLMSLVAIGRGLTLTSDTTKFTNSHGVVYRRISGEVVPFSAVWSPKNDNPALRRLLSLARARVSRTVSTPGVRTL